MIDLDDQFSHLRKWAPLSSLIQARHQLEAVMASIDQAIAWQSELIGLPEELLKKLHYVGIYTRKDLLEAYESKSLAKLRSVGPVAIKQVEEFLSC
jgi:putative methionine-R-sulfoxide reductase with GAF domain